MSVDWGTVPDWLAGTGSLFALIFAAVAVVVTRRTYHIESERDRVNAEARTVQQAFARRAQAALVSAWWGQTQDGQWGAFVRNASETPVYQVYATVVSADGNVDSHKFHYVVVPPSNVAIFCAVGDGASAQSLVVRRVKLSFTDAAGVRWLRGQYGRLTELEPSLRIKTEPKFSRVLAQFEDDFLATYGVTVGFEMDVEVPQHRFVEDLASSSVLDAVICPHDWIGDLIARDLIEPTVLSAEHAAGFPEWALSALTVEGRLYGLPTTVDTVALFRNTDLAPDMPATFDELIRTGKALCDAGRATDILAVRIGERGDPFQIWPLITGAGGWLFRRLSDGSWDPERIGLAEPETIAAFERIRAFGDSGTRVLRRSMGREEAIELFATRRSPYLISTSDALRRCRQTRGPVAISAVPSFSSNAPAPTFTLVHALVMAKRGANKAIAHELFADYLTHDHITKALTDGIDAPVARRNMINQDPVIRQFLQLCSQGMPMPAFLQMERVWRLLEQVELALIAGAPAEETARHAAAKLTALMASKESDKNG